MNACMSYAEGPIFALGEKYLGKYRRTMRNYGVSLHAFVGWYLQRYPECNEYGCEAFKEYLKCLRELEWHSYPSNEAFNCLLQELFPQINGRSKIHLWQWAGNYSREEEDLRREYMEKLLAREDRILVCPVYLPTYVSEKALDSLKSL